MTGDMSDRLKHAWPAPGGDYDAADVERRGRGLRRRRAMALAWISGAVVSVLLLSVGFVLGNMVQRDVIHPGESPASPSITAGRRIFTPAARVEGDKTVVPVTFPDGTTAEVVYPSQLMIAELGVTPQGGFGTLEGPLFNGCCARDFLFNYIDPDHPTFLSADPIKEFPGADGRTVRLVPAPASGISEYLVFDIGPWHMGVWASMTGDQLAIWALHLNGRISADGFPVLAASGPLRLSSAGEGGPFIGLHFGAVDGGNQLSLTLRDCATASAKTEPDGGVVMCKPEWSMWIAAAGDDQFVKTVAENIEIRNVRLARR